MVSLGYPGQVGIYVPGQVADYYAHRSGLAGHVADTSWHPTDIDSTIFDYAAWEAEVTPDEARAIIREEIAAAFGNVGDERVDNPDDTGPKSRSIGALLWLILRTVQGLRDDLGTATRKGAK